jgi:hypothetical protein
MLHCEKLLGGVALKHKRENILRREFTPGICRSPHLIEIFNYTTAKFNSNIENDRIQGYQMNNMQTALFTKYT